MPRRYKISYPGNSSQCVSHLEQGNSIYTAQRMSINPYRFQEDHHLVFGLEFGEGFENCRKNAVKYIVVLSIRFYFRRKLERNLR